MLFTQTRRCRIIAWILALTVLMALPLSAAYPKHDEYVSDKKSVLSANTVSALRDSNKRLLENRGVVIGVCITDSTGEEEIAAYTRNLFKEWDIKDGVLLVVDTAAEDYFAVQSMDIDNVLTNDELSAILKNYLESDFADGNVDRGVYKTILKLDEFLTAELPALNDGDSAEIGNAPAEDEPAEKEEKEETSGFVKAIKGIFTVFLVLLVLAVVAIGGLFVAAIFNDTAMELFQTYVLGMLLRRNVNTSFNDAYEYDDRLYNEPARNRQNGGRGNRREDPYYDDYGTAQRQNRQTGRKQSYDPYGEYDPYGYDNRPARPAGNRNGGRQQNQGYYDDYAQNNYPRQNSGNRGAQYPNSRSQGQYRTGNTGNRNRRQQYYDDYR